MKSWKARISVVLAVTLLLTQFVWPQAEVKASSINLALGKSVTVSEEDNLYSQQKEKAVDGNTDTQWSASSGVNPTHWLQVDLGGTYDISGADIMWKDNVIVTYKVEVSPDNVNWSVAADRTNNSEKLQTHQLAFEATAIRYVRVTVSSYNDTGAWPSIKELRVWEKQGPTLYRDDFVRGVDISTLTAIEDNGGKYYDSNGVERDLLDILKDRGVNYVRLRLWNDPKNSNGYNDKEDVIRQAKRVKAKGLKLLVDFHYSDDWAHPGQQVRPAAWKDLSFNDLVTAVYQYTYDVVSELKQEGAMPDMVQIGNEINSGVLTGNGGTVNFDDQIALLNSGANAVRAVKGGDAVKIMIHLAEGGKNSTFRYFFDGISGVNDVNKEVDYDIIGLSYYPFWHGSLEAVKSNMDDMAKRYGKEVIIAETSYPFSYKEGDAHENIINTPEKLNTGGATWPATVQGQYDAMKTIMDLIAQVDDDKGAGFFYWEPAWIPANVGWIAQKGDAWENQSMFDYPEYPGNGGHAYEGYALESLDVYKHGMTSPPADRKELAKAIADANLLVEIDFEPTSWPSLQPAIEAAQLVHNQAYSSLGVTQNEVNVAVTSLAAVIDAMEVISADKSALAAAIEQAESLVEGDWSAKTWAKLLDALAAAAAVNGDDRATQTVVNGATQSLQAALDGLSNIDKTLLASLIAAILKLDGAEYTRVTWTVLSNALTAATAVNNSDAVSQSEVLAAVAALETARDGLASLTDLTTGKLAIASSNNGTGGGQANSPEGAIDDKLDTSWGTDQGINSWWQVDLGEPALVKKLAMQLWGGAIKYRIEGSLDNEHFTTIVDTTNDVITSESPRHVLPEGTMVKYIRMTITGGGSWVGMLDFQAFGLIPANKVRLEETVTGAKLLAEEDYTSHSWLQLQLAITVAEGILSNVEADQSEADEATAVILAAIGALVEADVEQPEVEVGATGVVLDQTSARLNVGESVLLKASVNPVHATNKRVTFLSSNVGTVTVTGSTYDAETGITTATLRANEAGTAVITAATVDDGHTASFELIVDRPSVSPSSSPSIKEEQSTEAVKGSEVTINGIKPDSSGKLTASITANSLDQAAVNSVNNQVMIHVLASTETKAVSVQIPMSVITSLQEKDITSVQVNMNGVQIAVSVDALAAGVMDEAGVLEITAAQSPRQNLSEAITAAIGDYPIYDLAMTINGKKVIWNSGQVKVTLPYMPKMGQNPHQVVVYYLNDQGEAEVINNAVYDQETGTVAFLAAHFSKYAAAYKEVNFKDIGAFSWAKEAIEGLAAKHILQGTGDGTFEPSGNVTRSQFAHMLVQTLNLTGRGEASKMSDVQEGSWYYESVSIAEQLGIIQGKSDGTFGVNESITREDMAVMLHRALMKMELTAGTQPKVDSALFTDHAAISEYAKEAVNAIKLRGIISGYSNGSFAPKEKANRAQAAVIIANTLGVVNLNEHL